MRVGSTMHLILLLHIGPLILGLMLADYEHNVEYYSSILVRLP